MTEDKREVIVTDVKIPFWSLVMLMVKLSIAAIPAFIILLLLGSVASMLLAALFGGGMHYWELGRWWIR